MQAIGHTLIIEAAWPNQIDFAGNDATLIQLLL